MGNFHSNGESWHPNKLQQCICNNSTVTCKVNRHGCWDHLGEARANEETWVDDDGVTVCKCISGNTVRKTYPTKVCLDDKKIVRTQGSSWFMSNCTNCTCNDGKISCTQHDIKAFYGRFVVKAKTCYIDSEPHCKTSNEPTRDCYSKSISSSHICRLPRFVVNAHS